MLNGEGSRVVNEAGCGLTAASRDYEALATNVKKIYSLSKLGNVGRAYYDHIFAKDIVIDKVNEVLKSS